MELWLTIAVLGIIEGLTEFIPVSSTGHLILCGTWLNFEGPRAASFEIFIQLGAIAAVVVLYKERFRRLACDCAPSKKWCAIKPGTLNIMHLALTITPVVIAGFFLYSVIKNKLFNNTVVAIGLIAGGIVMIIIDMLVKRAHGKTPNNEMTHDLDNMTYRQALGVGIAQCFSLWPGVSRSGATIIGGVLSGLDYKIAAEYSFIVAVPVMIMAVGYDLLRSFSELTLNDAGYFIAGGMIAFIVAVFSIKLFIGLVQRFKLAPFGWYRIMIGSGVLLLALA
ncbi:MAG: undecaprenyl-diphosphate phosphatase [Candidatus Omnitrophica bacterium]|nr:undecaprenyl-diphosphate phosphatase [Candidatus Omnitrophota bacterium]